MSFTIRLSQDLTAVEAGATVPLSIEVTNKGDEADRFEMQVEGIDPEWTASPEPVFSVAPDETHSQKVFFKPPRASESLAGNYPFVIRVRSLNSGDARTAQGVLEIKPFHHLSMELSPKKGYATALRPNHTFTLTVMNLGNAEHTLQLSGADPEEECTYEFASDQITIGPGQQKDVAVTIAAARGGWFTPTRLFGFSISARSIQNPSILASTQGQLDRRPMLSPGTILTAVTLLAALLLWISVRPKPPTVVLSTSDSSIVRGQTLHLAWRASNASSVKLEINWGTKTPHTETVANLAPEGSRDILATEDGQITVHPFAIGENQTTEGHIVSVEVRGPPVANDPKILSFEASKTHLKLGESMTFTFSYSKDVTRIVLSPMTTQEIHPPATKVQIVPSQPGEFKYQLIAYNAQGGTATSDEITITVRQVSDATIAFFNASPSTVVAPDSKSTVTWSVSNAPTVTFDDGTGKGPRLVDAVNTAGLDVLIDHNVTLKLIATDAKGVSTSKTLAIKFKPLPPPPSITEPTTGGPPPTTAGTGTTGNTTGGR